MPSGKTPNPAERREAASQNQLGRGLTSVRSQSVLTAGPSGVDTNKDVESQDRIQTLEHKVFIMGNAKESLHKKHAYNQTKLQKKIEKLQKSNLHKDTVIAEKDKEIKL